MDARTLPGAAPPEPSGTLRDQQKAETRARVIEAARALFLEMGYEAATIRMIAARAGVAPGSVFTTFESKADLLQEIVFARYEQTMAAMLAEAALKNGVHARLAAAGRAAFEVDTAELRLFASTLGASWTWSRSAEREHRARIQPFLTWIGETLAGGAAAGELAEDLDVELMAEVIFACYLRLMRRALFDDWTPAQMAARFSDQVELILDGKIVSAQV